MVKEEDYDYAEQQDNTEPLVVECDVTLTITKRMKLKVYDVNIEEEVDYNGHYSREVDFSDTDWEEVIDDNAVTPKKWTLNDVSVIPLQW